MKAIITNKYTVIQNPSEQVVRHLDELMSYVDKQKQYQVRRLKKNKFNRGKSFLKKMEDEVTSSMLKRLDGGHIAFNSGLSYHIEKI